MMDHLLWRVFRGVALGATYAIFFWMLRVSNITLDQWYLPAGLRVAALLICPRSYWPYLIAGEAGALLAARFDRIEQYGLLFVVVSSITIMPLVAGLVRVMEKRGGLIEQPQRILLLAAFVAASTTLANTGLVFGLMREVRSPLDWTNSFQIMVGAYLGILTTTPLVLLWKQRDASYPFPRKLHTDAVAGIVVTLIAFFIAEALVGGTEKNMMRMLMIVPAAVLTVLHGWRGAAIGVVMSNTALAMTIQRTHTDGNTDPDALLVQIVLVVTATILISLGATISRYYRNATRYGAAEARALEIARKSFVASEVELERRVADIQFVIDEVFAKLNDAGRFLRQRGHPEAALEIQNYRVIHEQKIRDDLRLTYPSHLAEHGLYSAINTKMIAGKWGGHCNVSSSLRGDDQVIGPELQLMVYRVLDDVMALLAITGHQHLTITAKCNRTDGRAGIAITLKVRDTFHPAIFKMGDLDASGRVLAYGGRIRHRSNRIFLLMQEPAPATLAPASA
ncbi:MASE1 family protein [Lysobacter capsici]|uniref:MASE1 domain-containing protein n=1 Tax=Lysobacter capsici TaxID=435897 RepID=UPI00071657A3|nr:MASE1 domain-containing protein [Lysobacter capsici]ALN84929.1 MASE1 family protein [Lysobacter capsici]